MTENCDLCASDAPIYQMTKVCCCVRLILGQPNKYRRNAILHAIERRLVYANSAEVKSRAEEAFNCGRKKL
jgi:hypothetical protein